MSEPTVATAVLILPAVVKTFEADYGTKCHKAVAKITDNLDVLLEFYDYPAEHWVHLRTANPIVVLRHRQAPHPGHQRTRAHAEPGSRWRSNSSSPPRPAGRGQRTHMVTLVRAGARFEKGVLVERPDESGGDQQAA